MSGTVIGLFARASDAEIALNNLDEAGYAPSTISVVAKDVAAARALSDATGSLSKVPAAELPARLAALGLSEADGGVYRERMVAGAVFISVEAPDGSEEDAMEILTDQKADLVRRLPGSAGSR